MRRRYSRYYRRRSSGISTRIKNGYAQYNAGSGWKWTHRRVVEKKIGGRIRSGYEVHHVNGNKRDNRPINLRVLSRAAHRAIHLRFCTVFFASSK
jgi:hypothetical protein